MSWGVSYEQPEAPKHFSESPHPRPSNVPGKFTDTDIACRGAFQPRFMDEETEAQRSNVT